MKACLNWMLWGTLWLGVARAEPPLFTPSASVPGAERNTNAGWAVLPTIGLWYTAWWTKDDQFRHWANCHRLPARGRYSSGDPEVIATHYAQFRDLGVGFLIMDDTNCAGNDGGRINDNIRAWFDFMDARPAPERIRICASDTCEWVFYDTSRTGRRRSPRCGQPWRPPPG